RPDAPGRLCMGAPHGDPLPRIPDRRRPALPDAPARPHHLRALRSERHAELRARDARRLRRGARGAGARAPRRAPLLTPSSSSPDFAPVFVARPRRWLSWRALAAARTRNVAYLR